MEHLPIIFLINRHKLNISKDIRTCSSGAEVEVDDNAGVGASVDSVTKTGPGASVVERLTSFKIKPVQIAANFKILVLKTPFYLIWLTHGNNVIRDAGKS